MLQIVPETNDDVDLEEEEDDEIYCAACGHVVTRGCWRMAMNGGHEHTFFNPAGHVFRVVCFKEAPGAGTVGASSDEFTWFKGYQWRIAGCLGCAAHLGWRFADAATPAIFFGLIKPKLTTVKP